APLRVRMHDVILGPRVLLRTRPAMRRDVEDDAAQIGMLHLVAIRVVRIAHDPCGTRVARYLALFHHVIHPEADMVDADIVLPGPLRRFVALEVQDREIDDTVAQEHALGQRAVKFGDLLEADSLLVEFGGLPGILDAQRDMTDPALGLRGHGLLLSWLSE